MHWAGILQTRRPVPSGSLAGGSSVQVRCLFLPCYLAVQGKLCKLCCNCAVCSATLMASQHDSRSRT